MTHSKNIIQLTFGITVLALFTGYNFMFAVAPANPPASNTPAPINVGGIAQSKSSGLDVASLTVQGGSIFTGSATFNTTPTISNSAPMIKFDDTSFGDLNFWAHVNGSVFYILADRDGDGDWDSPHPMALKTGSATDASNDYAAFSNVVRANQYCDRSGANCLVPSNVQERLPVCDTDKILLSRGAGKWICADMPVAPVPVPVDWLVNHKHEVEDCQNLAGVLVTDGTDKFCQLPGATCPSGWTQFKGWDEYSKAYAFNSYCTDSQGAGSCSAAGQTWRDDNIVPRSSSKSCDSGSLSCVPAKTKIGCY